MSEKNSTIIIVVALLGVGIVIILVMNKKSAPPKPSGNTAVAQGVSILGGLFGAAGKIFTSNGKVTASPNGSSAGSSFFAPVNTVDTADQQAYATSHDVVAQEGNQLIDENTGNALVYGAD